MIKKTITYEDYDGNERTEDFYFNLSKAELTEWELSHAGGLSALLTKIVASNNTPEIMAFFKEIITKSYGEKSLDGRRFVKSPEITEAFLQTPAYDIFFMEIMENTDSMSDFINGLMPNFDGKEAAIQEAKNKYLEKVNSGKPNVVTMKPAE